MFQIFIYIFYDFFVVVVVVAIILMFSSVVDVNFILYNLFVLVACLVAWFVWCVVVSCSRVSQFVN